MVETASFFVLISYAPWLLKSYLGHKACANCLAAYKASFTLCESYPKLGQSFLSSMQKHLWYLTHELVLFSIADNDKEKNKILFQLMKHTIPKEFCTGKTDLPAITSWTELCDLTDPGRWLLRKLSASLIVVESWIKGMAGESIHVFKTLVQNIHCNNNCTERNIRLIQDFVSGYKC